MERWEKVRAVERIQQYIDNHLKERITLLQLAKVAGYSPWHTTRVFKDLVGKTPFEYIRMLRLTKAAHTLKHSQEKIIDVAFDYVFDSHEGFTRAFAKQFGVSPSHYSKNKPPLKLFMPPRIHDYYLRLQIGDGRNMSERTQDTVFVQVVDRDARQLILKRGVNATHYFDYCDEVGCDVWEILCEIKEATNEPMGLWLPDNMRPEGTSTYVQGVEVATDFSGEIPDGFEVVDLPACKLMVFQGPPFEDSKFEQAISDLWAVMKSYQPETYGFEWADEDAPRFQLIPEGYRGYIEGRPVRPISK